MSTLATRLRTVGACKEAVDWAKGREWPVAWQECERGDWMLWLAGAMQGKSRWPTRQQIVLVACDCAELVLPIFEKKYPTDKRVRECIETTRKWANGEAAIEDVHKARDAAYAADDAAAAAAYADAAYAAADAAYAAYAAYAAAYAAASRQDRQKQCADLCRKHLTVPQDWLAATDSIPPSRT